MKLHACIQPFWGKVDKSKMHAALQWGCALYQGRAAVEWCPMHYNNIYANGMFAIVMHA